MLIIETHETKSEADRARKVIVTAQQRVDKVLEQLCGLPVFPPAENAYVVVPHGDRFALAIDDPSLPHG